MDNSSDSNRRHHCETCGYNLHNNESGLCPECGAVGPGARRMPPQWRILIIALGLPFALMFVWLVWSLVLRLTGGS